MHNLFVYGTLRRNARRTDAQQAPYELLSRNAQFAGEATVEGTLHDLGNYTGMVVPGSDRIIGDVFAIEPSQWDFVIARLDAYEGCTENDPRPHEYRRDVVQARLSSGEMVPAWAYVLNR